MRVSYKFANLSQSIGHSPVGLELLGLKRPWSAVLIASQLESFCGKSDSQSMLTVEWSLTFVESGQSASRRGHEPWKHAVFSFICWIVRRILRRIELWEGIYILLTKLSWFINSSIIWKGPLVTSTKRFHEHQKGQRDFFNKWGEKKSLFHREWAFTTFICTRQTARALVVSHSSNGVEICCTILEGDSSSWVVTN